MGRLTEASGLTALFVSSFLSSTLLPGSSEAVLVTILLADAVQLWPALGVATAGNTLGGMTSYAVGRVLPKRVEGRAMAWLQRYGAAALLLSWLPILGDALCVAAGWLRLNVWQSVFFVALGKFVRYWVLAKVVL